MIARLTAFGVALVVAILPFATTGTAQDKKETVQEEVLRLTNAYQVKNKVPEAKQNDKLAAAAQKHADNLAKLDKPGDNGDPHILDGKNCTDRAKAAGYESDAVQEIIHLNNLKSGQAAYAVRGWIESPGHRKVLLTPYTETGVGVAKSASGQWYFCQVFGNPRGPLGFTISLNNESPEAVTVRFKGAKGMTVPTGKGANYGSSSPFKEYPVEVLAAEGQGKVTTFTARNGAAYVITGNAKDGFKVAEKK